MDNIRDELAFITKRNQILFELEQLAINNNYIKVESDYFEDYLAFLQQNERQDPQKLVKVQDLRGNVLVLRPDITTNIIKQVIPRMDASLQVAFYYMDQIFSYNDQGDIEKRRQFGVELIGDEDLSSDVQLLAFIQEIFQLFDLDIMIELGNQRFIERLISNLELSSKETKALKTAIIAKNSTEVLAILKQKNTPYKELLLQVLETESDLEGYLTFVTANNLDQTLQESLRTMRQIVQELPTNNIQFDLSLINPFDYYNGPIFKGYIKGYQTDILRGGRYDSLTKDYGKKTPALGFSLDVDILIQEVSNNG